MSSETFDSLKSASRFTTPDSDRYTSSSSRAARELSPIHHLTKSQSISDFEKGSREILAARGIHRYHCTKYLWPADTPARGLRRRGFSEARSPADRLHCRGYGRVPRKRRAMETRCILDTKGPLTRQECRDTTHIQGGDLCKGITGGPGDF